MNPLLLPNRLFAAPIAGTRSPRESRTGQRARRSAALALMMAALCAHVQAQPDDNFDDDAKLQQEMPIQLPPAPQPQNLLPFYVSPTATYSFAIDANSVTVGKDGIIRYTLVATSDGGARNVSYEGIRCSTHESKLYAIGQVDGSWTRSRRNTWKTIHGYTANRERAALANDYFCRELTIAGSAKDIIDRIRNKRTLAPQSIQ